MLRSDSTDELPVLRVPAKRLAIQEPEACLTYNELPLPMNIYYAGESSVSYYVEPRVC